MISEIPSFRRSPMSQVVAFPIQSREGPPSPSAEVQKQTLLDYLTAFGLANQLTQDKRSSSSSR